MESDIGGMLSWFTEGLKRDFETEVKRYEALSAGYSKRMKFKEAIESANIDDLRAAMIGLRPNLKGRIITLLPEACPVCGWLHDSDFTAWTTPGGKERHIVTHGTARHALLTYLHEGMAKNGYDVSMTAFMKQHCQNGQQPKDILGNKLLSALFESTGASRGRIRPPDFKRLPGRPKSKK